MIGDMPSMATAMGASSTYSAGDFQQAQFIGERLAKMPARLPQAIQTLTQKELPPMTTRRIVQVFIADPNENVPLDDCLLYKGEEKLTDATDQELFFELDIKNILETHNQKRVKFIDKKVKDRTEHLEPIKVRELKMVVVTVANL